MPSTRPLGDVISDLVVQWGNECIQESESTRDGEAMFRRANYYLVGWGIFGKDRAKALHWLGEAEKAGFMPAGMLLKKVAADPNFSYPNYDDEDYWLLGPKSQRKTP